MQHVVMECVLIVCSCTQRCCVATVPHVMSLSIRAGLPHPRLHEPALASQKRRGWIWSLVKTATAISDRDIGSASSEKGQEILGRSTSAPAANQWAASTGRHRTELANSPDGRAQLIFKAPLRAGNLILLGGELSLSVSRGEVSLTGFVARH